MSKIQNKSIKYTLKKPNFNVKNTNLLKNLIMTNEEEKNNEIYGMSTAINSIDSINYDKDIIDEYVKTNDKISIYDYLLKLSLFEIPIIYIFIIWLVLYYAIDLHEIGYNESHIISLSIFISITMHFIFDKKLKFNNNNNIL